MSTDPPEQLVMITIRVTRQERDQISERAERVKLSMNRFARQALGLSLNPINKETTLAEPPGADSEGSNVEE